MKFIKLGNAYFIKFKSLSPYKNVNISSRLDSWVKFDHSFFSLLYMVKRCKQKDWIERNKTNSINAILLPLLYPNSFLDKCIWDELYENLNKKMRIWNFLVEHCPLWSCRYFWSGNRLDLCSLTWCRLCNLLWFYFVFLLYLQ